jgi:hypothetical protein
MTLTIEVAADVESALAAKAARLGVPVERYAAGVLRRDVESNGHANGATTKATAKAARDAAHRDRVRAGFGKFAHVPGTVADFMSERSEEAAREMQRETA